MSSAIDRAWLRVERFLWFAVAAIVAGAWVFYEALTGREVPGHAHPVFAALVAAALAFGGVDLRRVARIRQELLAVARDAGVDARELEAVAHQIAVLETENPRLLQALRALSHGQRPPGRPKTDPHALPASPARGERRRRTQPGDPS